MADVEFSALIEERLFDILLEDEGFGSAILVGASPLQNRFNFVQSEAHNYPVSSICQFSWLDDPNIIESNLLPLLLALVVTLQEIGVLLIDEPFFDVESER